MTTKKKQEGCTVPDYWNDAKSELMRCDRVLRRLIPKHDGACLETRGDPFLTLARSIVGQQISAKSADLVWEKLFASVTEFTPARVARIKMDKLRACGLTQRKADYILDLAAHFKQGGVNIEDWQVLDDEAVINALTGIRGIGRRTAEMFLIFNLMRPNVFPADDASLQKAVSCIISPAKS